MTPGVSPLLTPDADAVLNAGSALGSPDGPVARAVAALAAYADDAGIAHEPGAREGEVVLTLPGERKLKTVVSVLVRERYTSVSAFVIRNADENHAAFYRFLLRRSMRLPFLGYAVDEAGDVYVRGQVPTAALDGQLLDHLMGAVLEGADEPFNDLLVLGFLTSMKKEWAWRVSRGESLANLEAFRGILTGSEREFDMSLVADPSEADDSPGQRPEVAQ